METLLQIGDRFSGQIRKVDVAHDTVEMECVDNKKII